MMKMDKFTFEGKVVGVTQVDNGDGMAFLQHEKEVLTKIDKML